MLVILWYFISGEPTLPSPSLPHLVLLNKNVAKLRRKSRETDNRPPTPPSWDTQNKGNY